MSDASAGSFLEVATLSRRWRTGRFEFDKSPGDAERVDARKTKVGGVGSAELHLRYDPALMSREQHAKEACVLLEVLLQRTLINGLVDQGLKLVDLPGRLSGADLPRFEFEALRCRPGWPSE